MLLCRELQYVTCVRNQYETLIPPRNLFTNMTHEKILNIRSVKAKIRLGNPIYLGHLTTDSLNIKMNAANLRVK
jgi:hypothetical protein